MSEWKECKLRDVAELVKDVYRPLNGSNHHYIGLEHIQEGALRLSGIGSSDDITSQKFFFKANDILFGKLRPYFRKVIKPNFEGICSTDIYVFRAKTGYDQGFLFYFLANQEFVDLASSADSGTRMPRADWGFLKETAWKIPPLQEQHGIASVLSSLDDKIDLMHCQNKTLEALAEALFRKRFVDEVDPAWEKDKLGAYGDFKNGINYSRDENGDTEFSILNVRDIVESKYLKVHAYEKIKIDSKKAEPYLLKVGDIVIVRSASPGETSIILEDTQPLIYSGFSIRFRPVDSEYSLFFFQFFQSFKKEMDLFSEGTTLKNLNQQLLNSIELSIPPKKVVQEYNEILDGIYKKITRNFNQIHTLERLRDTLLPKLMSGEVRVRS
jgi:type I restriction enzyme S subunit